MNPSARTLVFAGAAAVCAVTAYISYQSTQPSDLGGYSEVGSEFFPEFADAAKARSLTVVAYDGDTGDPLPFSVEQNDDGLWVIPSHHDYPAEAEDRLARTATSLLGVKKTAVASRVEEDWKRFGVIDPSADVSADEDQRGTRLTLSDNSGNPLVDLIVGKSVEGRSSHYYVREPEKKTTYISELDVDLSAKFSDWIEPDLLKLNSNDIVKLVLDNYSVDEQRGAVLKKETLEFTKAGLESSGDWELNGLDAEKEELDKSPVSSIATNLDQLKIVGVRPKPEGLSDDLRVPPQLKQILKDQLDSEMRAQGYFIGADESGKGEKLYGNEGELVAGTGDGVQYTLYFGEIARGTGKDIEVGLSTEEGDEKDADGESAEEEEDGPRRYLLVKVELNESLLGAKPVAPLEPAMPEILKEDENEGASEEGAKEEGKPEETESDKAAAGDDDGSCNPFDEDESKSDESAGEEAASESEGKDESSENEKGAAAEESSGEDKSAADGDDKGTQKDATKAAAADETENKPADAGNEESGKPEEQDEKPAIPEKTPKELAQESYDAAKLAYESSKRTYESDLKAWEDKLEKGQEKVDELSTRFAGWYYVISSDSFEKFRITRNDVVSKKEEEKPAETEAGAGN